VALQPLRSEGGPPTPHRSLFAPHALPNRNGSLSYDSLLNPGSPGGHACPAHPAAGAPGYRSPYLHAGAPGDPPRPPPRSFSPVLGPRPREPSPVRYDNLSRTIMASIQERKDREERERLLRSQADSLFGDSGVYDTPSSYSLQQAGVLSEGPRGLGLRCGSRDDLVAGPGFGGARNPALQTSLSSLSSAVSRAPRTSSSSLQTDLASSGGPGVRPTSGPHRSPVHQVPPSPPGTPCSPSYAGPKAVAFIHADLPEPPPSLAVQRWVLECGWPPGTGQGSAGLLAGRLPRRPEATLGGGPHPAWRLLLASVRVTGSKDALDTLGWGQVILHLEPTARTLPGLTDPARGASWVFLEMVNCPSSEGQVRVMSSCSGICTLGTMVLAVQGLPCSETGKGRLRQGAEAGWVTGPVGGKVHAIGQRPVAAGLKGSPSLSSEGARRRSEGDCGLPSSGRQDTDALARVHLASLCSWSVLSSLGKKGWWLF